MLTLSVPQTPCSDGLGGHTRLQLADGHNLIALQVGECVVRTDEDLVVPGIGVALIVEHIAIGPAPRCKAEYSRRLKKTVLIKHTGSATGTCCLDRPWACIGRMTDKSWSRGRACVMKGCDWHESAQSLQPLI